MAGSAAAGLASGCGDAPPFGEGDDAELLNEALATELSAILAYETGAELLSGDVAAQAEVFAEHAREHAKLLREEIAELGGTVVEEPADDLRRDLKLDERAASSEGGDELFLSTAAELSDRAVATYIEIAAKLNEPRLRGTAFEIAAVEAEQVAVVRGALGEPQVPEAFVAGAPS